MSAASSALHVVDMANIKQTLLIPQRPLRLSVSLTSVQYVVYLWITVYTHRGTVCVCEANEGKCEYSCMWKAET